ncbi:MAG TPA: hypothetical protein VMM78_05305 [Thermomicrobiales bacterium]|nr:hypothetical protein [Thermomicrobiales bacterium]
MPTGEDDPVHIVRMIGRLAQMVLELRDEYVETRRDDALEQLDRRMQELHDLHTKLLKARADIDAGE